MSNYSKTTDFAAKDSLPSGDSGKIIRGSEFETEFDNISTAIATKADAADPTFTGTVTIDGLTVNGNTVLGNADTDTVTVTADIASNLIPSADDTYNLGASGAEWNDLYVDGTAYIDDISGGSISGTSFASTGNMTFGDNNKAIFGASNDLQIYHDGTDTQIREVGAGNLKIITDGAAVQIQSTLENMIVAQPNAGVQLFYDNSQKLTTNSTGIDVTGTVTADGLTVDTSAGVTLNGTGTGATHQINRGTGATNNTRPVVTLNADSTGDAADGFGASIKFELSDTAVDNSELGAIGFKRDGGDGLGMFAIGQDSQLLHTNRQFTVAANGDISFYEDTGTTAKFFWDASAERLGIGTSSPSTELHISTSAATGSRLTLENTDFDLSVNDVLGAVEFKKLDASGAGAGVASSIKSLTTDLGGATALTFATGSASGNNVEAMRIDSSGNVGFGTQTITNSTGYQRTSINGSNGGILEIKSSDTPVARFLATGGSGQLSTLTAIPLLFNTNGTERMRIDSSGNVGIGTTNPSTRLHIVSATGDVAVRLDRANSSTATTSIELKNGGTGNPTTIIESGGTASSSNGIVFKRGNSGSETEQMRIDSSGNLLLGTTNTTPGVGNTDAGASVRRLNGAFFSRTSATPLHLNRSTDDGTIVDFRKDGANVGGVGSKDGDLFIHTGTTGLRFVDGGNSIRPVTSNGNIRDNAIDLGGTTSRWKDLYLSGGISFNPNASANKLDDYEEGTWSPVYAPSTGAFTTLTMDIVNATYTKVGNIVTINVFLRTDDVDIGTASGTLKISGIPFTASGYNSLSIGYSSAFASNTPSHGWVQGSFITLQYRANADTSSVNATTSSLTTGTTANRNVLAFTATYTTTA